MTRGDACTRLVAALCAAGYVDAADVIAATATPAADDVETLWRACYAATQALPQDDVTWPLRWALVAYRDLAWATTDDARERYGAELRRALARNTAGG